MAKTVRLINAGSYLTRGEAYDNIARDRRMVNYVRRVDQESGKVYFEKRQGWNSTDSATTGSTSTWSYGRCFLRNSEYNGRAVLLASANVFSGTSGIDVIYGGTSLGQITQGTASMRRAFLTEAVTSGGSHHLITIEKANTVTSAVESSLMYYFTPTSATASGALTQVTDGDLPTYFRGPATQKWGFVFLHGNNGSVHNFDINSISSITGGNYFPCDAIPDNGFGVWENGPDMLAAFGGKHIELLVNSGRQTLSPLLRADGGVIEIGVRSSKHIYSVGGTLYFMGRPNGTNANGIYTLRGAQITKISGAGVDSLLQTFGSGLFNMNMACVPVWGEPTLLIQMNTSTTYFTLACRLSDNYFYEWGPSATDPIYPVGISTLTGAAEFFSGMNTTRYVYTTGNVDPAYDDNGQTFTGTIQSARSDFGTAKKKSGSWMDLIGDTSTTGDAHVVSISTDDSQNWTQLASIDMSTRNRRIPPFGAFDDLAIKIEHATATPSRIEGLDVTATAWGH